MSPKAPETPHWDGLIALILYMVLSHLYLSAPVLQITDTAYSLLLSHQLLHAQRFDIDPEQICAPATAPENCRPYQFLEQGDRWLYGFPHGSSILAVPIVALLDFRGHQVIDAQGRYNADAAGVVHQVVGSVVASSIVVLGFFIARTRLHTALALLSALGLAMATSVLSTLSRGMWPHGWGVLLLIAALYLVLQRPLTAYRTVVLGTMLAWMYFVRPTFSLSIVTLTLFVAWRQPRQLGWLLATGTLWLLLFVLHSLWLWGDWLPPYYQTSRLGSNTVLEAALGHWLSPSRGLLVFSPILLWVGGVLWSCRRHVSREDHALCLIALAVVLLHWLALAHFAHWWGGHSYGPRLMADILPWLFLLGVVALRHVTVLSRPVQGLGVLLLALSVHQHAVGAWSWRSMEWNTLPGDIDSTQERLWDWHAPQFLAAWQTPPRLEQWPTLAPQQRIVFAGEQGEALLGDGWSVPERDFRWSDAHHAELRFVLKAKATQHFMLRLHLHPFVHPLYRPTQTAHIRLNGQAVGTLILHAGPPRDTVLHLPAQLLRERNRLQIALPDATAPSRFAAGADRRQLALALHWLQLEPLAAP